MLRYAWILKDITSRMWFSASIYGVVAVLTPLIAALVEHFIPAQLPDQVGVESVDSILNVLAMSMLSVTIFSLSTMVAAYAAATSNVTPRATRLLIRDKISHRALSTFLGSFIFSIVGIAALKGGVYGDMGRFVLYVMTMGVIAMVVFTLLRWIEYLARLGRVDETIERVERATSSALESRLKSPALGAHVLDKALPKTAKPIYGNEIGHVQHIDMGMLDDLAEDHGIKIYVTAHPGKFINPAVAIAHIASSKKPTSELADAINRAFITDEERSFQQDPRYGLSVMQEIAVRALSPAVNDPGTAIHVINSAVRVLAVFNKHEELAKECPEPKYKNVYMEKLNLADMYEDIFPPIARDGAGNLQVHIWLQKAFAALSKMDYKDANKIAKAHSDQAFKRAEQGMTLKDDVQALKKLKQDIFK